MGVYVCMRACMRACDSNKSPLAFGGKLYVVCTFLGLTPALPPLSPVSTQAHAFTHELEMRGTREGGRERGREGWWLQAPVASGGHCLLLPCALLAVCRRFSPACRLATRGRHASIVAQVEQGLHTANTPTPLYPHRAHMHADAHVCGAGISTTTSFAVMLFSSAPWQLRAVGGTAVLATLYCQACALLRACLLVSRVHPRVAPCVRPLPARLFAVCCKRPAILQPSCLPPPPLRVATSPQVPQPLASERHEPLTSQPLHAPTWCLYAARVAGVDAGRSRRARPRRRAPPLRCRSAAVRVARQLWQGEPWSRATAVLLGN